MLRDFIFWGELSGESLELESSVSCAQDCDPASTCMLCI